MSGSPSEGDEPVPERRRLGGQELRALAHPLRVQLLELLREGPATASILARRLGESAGSTSYHLRCLHRYGFVEDDAGRGKGRERWWRRRERMLLVTAPAGDADADAAEAQLQSVLLQRDETALERFLATPPGERWREATLIGNWTICASPDEVRELSERVLALVDPLRRSPDESPRDAGRVHVTFRALPQAGPRPE